MSVLSLFLSLAMFSEWCSSDSRGTCDICIFEAGGGGGGGPIGRVELAVPPCAKFLPCMVKRKRKRSRARGRLGGRPHRRSVQAAARRWARAQQHVRDVRSRRLAWRTVRRVIVGTQARLIFAQPCAEQEALALL